MKVLEITNYSAGICGVWTRVKEEAKRLSYCGHEVLVLSSNLEKGTNKIVENEDQVDKVKIKRFSAIRFPFAESFMVWLTEKRLKQEIKEFNPDVIIVHSYRHPHSVVTARVARKLKIKCFLVTHAPFGDINRSVLAKYLIKFYHDPLVGKNTLQKYDQIITITKWELPYLMKLGVQKNKISYIPNGIPEEFFSKKKTKETNKILFLGRISPIKDIETLLNAMALIKNKDLILEIVGPAEKEYLSKLLGLVSQLNLQNRIIFSPPIYDLAKKIAKIDSAKIFVLPSKREAMPQALIEAMAREKIVISSKNPGSKEIIENGKNGLLFEISDAHDLAKKIDMASSVKNTNLKKNARITVEKFKWDKLISKLQNLIDSNNLFK